jgi:hypothetical protein
MHGKTLLCLLFLSSLIHSKIDTLHKEQILEYIRTQTRETEFVSIQRDLNDDGVKDLLVGLKCSPGKACLYYCFIKAKKKYITAGTVYFDRSCAEILKTKHNGLCDILAYMAKDDETGNLVRYEFNGSKYEMAGSVRGTNKLKKLIRAPAKDGKETKQGILPDTLPSGRPAK